MSYHVYIAQDGFKNNPITPPAWLAAARQCDEVAVEEKKNRYGRIHHAVNLKGNTRAWLSLTPYGLVHAQDPSRELVAVMFKLAALLGAGVYSERLKPYRSVEDWERRTANYRQQRDQRRAAYAGRRRLRAALWLAFIIALFVMGWLLGGP